MLESNLTTDEIIFNAKLSDISILAVHHLNFKKDFVEFRLLKSELNSQLHRAIILECNVKENWFLVLNPFSIVLRDEETILLLPAA